jgi:hypothetical protein
MTSSIFCRSALLLAFISIAAFAHAQLIISEVVEGTSGNFKYIEILNRGTSAVDLASPQISLRRYTNGAITSSASVNLTGLIPAGGRILVANNQADLDAVYGAGNVTATITNTAINHNGDDSWDLFDGTNVLDGFAKDWTTGTDPGNPAADGVYFRVLSALPNNGDWGGTSPTPIADGTTSPSGAWHRVAFTANNGGASTSTTPLTGGGGPGGLEVPVELSSFMLD